MESLSVFDYEVLPEADRQLVKTRADSIRQTARQTAENIVRIGFWLTEVKERLPHGKWLPWLETEFSWSDRTALRFIQVYEAVKSDIVADCKNGLQIDVTALYLIAAPSTPEPVREDVIHRARNGEHITVGKVKEPIKDHQKPKEPPPPTAWQTGTLIADNVPTGSDEEEKEEEEEEEEKLCHQLGMELIDAGYKVLASKLHPDKGGSQEGMARLKRVRNTLRLNASHLGHTIAHAPVGKGKTTIN